MREGRRRALISVTDKSGLIEFVRGLVALEYEIVSTGGTAAALRAAGMPVTEVDKVTGLPELMEGRLKTLHPKIHGGLLARAGTDDRVMREHDIEWIDVLAVNLYPFEQVSSDPACSDEDAIENIDIGGPALLRAGAKNHERVTVVVDPADYPRALEALRNASTPSSFRRELAVKAFAHTARYDSVIASHLGRTIEKPAELPPDLLLRLEKRQELRYGENPHQPAALYRTVGDFAHDSPLEQLQGKWLSFNNMLDTDAALRCVIEFDEPACVIVKHGNPCGVALGRNVLEAYEQAFKTDPTSAYGGVIAFNRVLDEAVASTILARQFVEIVVAPEIDSGGLAQLAKKAAIRVLRFAPALQFPDWELRTTQSGILIQRRDSRGLEEPEMRIVTRKSPSKAQLRELRFAWNVAKHVKSNAIVYTKGGATVGIGAGQTSRVMSARVAALKAKDEGLSLRGAVMASDAFFPFRDGIDIAAKHRIRAVIQPGGSLRDEEVIAAADEHGMAMVFTGTRHFRH